MIPDRKQPVLDEWMKSVFNGHVLSFRMFSSSQSLGYLESSLAAEASFIRKKTSTRQTDPMIPAVIRKTRQWVPFDGVLLIQSNDRKFSL